MARNDVYIYTNATSPANAVITAQQTTTAATFPDLVLGDSPLFNFYFTDGTASWPSWAGNAAYSVEWAIGESIAADDPPLALQTQATAITGGWQIRLPLATGALINALNGVRIGQEFPVARLWQHIRVKDSNGYAVSYALIRTNVRLRAVPDSQVAPDDPLPSGTEAVLVNAGGQLVDPTNLKTGTGSFTVESGGALTVESGATATFASNVTATGATTIIRSSHSSALQPRGFVSDNYGNFVNSGTFLSRHARGTEASPAAVQSGDSIGNWCASGHDGTQFQEHQGILQFWAAENFVAGSNYGSDFTVQLNPKASGYGTTETARFYSEGDLGLPRGGLRIKSGALVSFAGTAVPSLSNYALYGDSTNTYVNVPAGGRVQLRVDNTAALTCNSAATAIAGNAVVSGNLTHAVPASAPSLTTNGTLTWELTSNTSLKVFVRGTDGTTRSATLTLS